MLYSKHDFIKQHCKTGTGFRQKAGSYSHKGQYMKRHFLTKFLLFPLCSILFAAVFSHMGAVFAAPRVQPTDEKLVIVIDPGHGGINEGTVEALNFMENGFPEKEMTLATAYAMYDELCLYDNLEVHMTRTDDRDLSLKERAEFAASVQADFLFSIHYNASVDHDLFGSEVWISAEPPYNAYGFQFGFVQMETMRDMGLFLRGTKTRLNDSGSDYYGIIRESTALSIPSVIIEHCHVDEARDIVFCENREQWEAFGRADALSVAKYFGLSSAALGVDYSEEGNRFPEASENVRVLSTLKDETPPEICRIELLDAGYDTGILELSVSAADFDSALLYYDYSIDGGNRFGSLQPWPDSDAVNGTYTDTFTLTLAIPSGIIPSVIVRAYNLFDIPAESNCLQSLEVFRYGEEAAVTQKPASPTASPSLPGTKTFRPVGSGNVTEGENEVSFLTFLQICLVFVVALFAIFLVSQYVSCIRRKKRRCQRRKDAGAKTNQRK